MKRRLKSFGLAVGAFFVGVLALSLPVIGVPVILAIGAYLFFMGEME